MIDGGLRPMFRKYLSDAQWTSIESGFTGQGIPDSEYCFSGGIQGWIEFKKTNTDKVHHVKPEQIGWLERRRRMGGRSFVIVRKILERAGTDDLWIIDGMAARIIKSSGLMAVPDELMLLRTAGGGPDAWDWNAVRRVLHGAVSIHRSNPIPL